MKIRKVSDLETAEEGKKDNGMKPQAMFFDHDGVLADSVEVKTEAFACLYRQYGPEIEARVIEHHRRHGGMTRRDKILYWHQEFLGITLTEEGLGHLCREFADLVVDGVIAAPDIHGVRGFLEYWSERLPCFVVSAVPDDELLHIVEQRHLKVFFKEILGSSRTKSENIEYLLARYRFEASACVFFGDAGSDYHAAGIWGIPFVGILPGPDAPLLQEAPGIEWYRDFADLVRSDSTSFGFT